MRDLVDLHLANSRALGPTPTSQGTSGDHEDDLRQLIHRVRLRLFPFEMRLTLFREHPVQVPAACST